MEYIFWLVEKIQYDYDISGTLYVTNQFGDTTENVYEAMKFNTLEDADKFIMVHSLRDVIATEHVFE